MEQRAFVKIIQSFQRRLNIASVIQKSIAALSIGAGVGILFQAAAFIIPFYDASLYAMLALCIAFVTALGIAYAKRISLKQTALVMDRFGFDERIVTAYECLGQEGVLIELQRDDAMEQLVRHQDLIQIPLLPSWKKTVLFVILMMVMSGLSLLPSAVKERAGELHEVREEAKEKMNEIKEFVDSLEELTREELSQEQKAALQEMIESLNDSQAEYAQAESAKMLTAASNKLEYKYETIGSELAQFAKRLQSGAAASAMAEKMGALTGLNQSGQDGQAFIGSQGSQNGNNGEGSQTGQSSQNGNNGKGSQTGQSSNSSPNGPKGDGSQGGNNGGGQTRQSGKGSQDGQQGNGRGTLSSSTPHDYVSIPNDIADSGNLTGNAVNHEDSVYFRAQNGLSWEGTHMSYEAVLGSYEQKAYEGIAAGRYPSGMEEVIKQYFSSFNQ